ncbi:hypothetical protein L218DRAFT_967612 [Marasmius fiardii PR-910]|nr:hypothetical protein L218DRAFT_967612 [Marasmius fiardii PR-910]
MGVKLNPKSRLALLFGVDADGYVQTAIKGTSYIDVRSPKPIIHENLAPSFGNNEHAFEAIKELDDHMKVAILVSTNKLLELKNSGDLTWNRILGVLNSNPVLVSNSGSEQIVKEFVSETSANFKFSEGSPDPELVRKVMTWWESEACPDPDIRADSRLDIDSLAKVVAWTGAAITNFSNFLSKRQWVFFDGCTILKPLLILCTCI